MLKDSFEALKALVADSETDAQKAIGARKRRLPASVKQCRR